MTRVGDDRVRPRLFGSLTATVGRIYPHAIRNHRQPRTRAVTGFQICAEGCGNRDIPIRSPPDTRLAPRKPLQFSRGGTRGRCHKVRKRRRDVRGIPVRFVNDRRTKPARQVEEQRGHAEIARQQHVRPAPPKRTSQRKRHIAKPPRRFWSTDRRAVDPQLRVGRQSVIRERVPCGRLRVWSDDQIDIVSAHRHRMTRLHRLNAVRAL